MVSPVSPSISTLAPSLAAPDAKEGQRGTEQRSMRIGDNLNDRSLLTSSDSGADAFRLVFFYSG